jgi:hypothetical protein
MAIGIRITSNNLNGKVANVTFNPSTGGTINIGDVTIPFNYITEFPYGTYQVYVPFYDYTYDLTINQPVDVKSFVFVSKTTTNNNNGIVNLNYGDLTATVFNLGIDSTGWYINDLYPITNSGYAIYFQNDNTCELQWVVFIDSEGNVIDSYQTNCDCEYDYNILGGKYATFEDYYNRVLKIFNGKEITTLSPDDENEAYFTVDDYDGVLSNNNIIVAKQNLSANTFTLNILNNNTLIPFGDVYTYSTGFMDFSTYFDGNFIRIKKYNSSLSSFEYIKIYDGSTGNLLQNIDLTTNIYNQDRYSFYGNNKLIEIYWSNSDSSIDYLIIHYDGNTNTLNTTTHNRLNYQGYPELRTNTNLYPNAGGSDSFSLMLYDNSGSYNGIGTYVSYCDILYMLSGDTNIQTFTFQNSGVQDKTIRTYVSLNDNIFVPCDNGDGKVSILSITSSGINYHDTNLLMSSNPQVSDMVECGNGFVGSFFDDTNYTQMSLIHITETGTLGDVINGINLTGVYQRNVEYYGNLYHFRPYTGDTYYIIPNSSSFQIGNFTGSTVNSYNPQTSFKEDFLRRGNLLYIDYTNSQCCLLTESGLTSTFNLPIGSAGYSVSVGETTFMYVYNDSITNFITINLYDFNFNLLNSQITTFTNIWTTDSCNDNHVLIINENNKYYIYLVSENEITYKELSDNNSYYTFNDYVWWD